MARTGQVAAGFAVSIVLWATAPVAAGTEPIFADGFESGGTCGWGFGTVTCPGFQIQTPEVELAPGEESTWCYYFLTPNVGTLGIRRWTSTFGPAVHDAILYTTYDNDWDPAERQPPGTLTQSPCGFAAGGGWAAWTYAAYAAVGELVLPGDDGAGAPLAVEMAAGQPAFLRMHFINATDQTVTGSVVLGAEALAPAVAYTKTATYQTYNGSLSIPPGAIGDTETQTCAVPADIEFWRLSTHTHRNAIEAKIRDGATTLVVTNDWENPAVTSYASPGFYAFSASGLTYECTYNNSGASTITTGDSDLFDENCVAIGYFFPATRPMICYNSIGPL